MPGVVTHPDSSTPQEAFSFLIVRVTIINILLGAGHVLELTRTEPQFAPAQQWGEQGPFPSLQGLWAPQVRS